VNKPEIKEVEVSMKENGAEDPNEKERNEEILRTLVPTSEKDFLILAKAIAKRTNKYSASFHYSNFVKELAKQLTDPLTIDDLYEIVNGINEIINDKLKSTKTKGKKKRKEKNIKYKKKVRKP